MADVLQALASLVLVPTRAVPSQPAWLPARPLNLSASQSFADPLPDQELAEQYESASIRRWPVQELLAARNALVHLPSLLAGVSCTCRPTPRFFNASSLEYDFDPNAPAPQEWLSFLDQVWQGDPESIAWLQEWFGYLLTPDTRQQKILMMVGPKRSGAARSPGAEGAGRLEDGGQSHPRRPWPGRLALPRSSASRSRCFPTPDSRAAPIMPRSSNALLSISGEDDQTIDRKHLPAWTGKLPTRFVLISNELPRLGT